MTQPLVSIVVPVFNEELSLMRFHAEVSRIIADLGDYDWEFIFVDDGSRDGSFRLLEALAGADSRVRAIGFPRNFGSHIAIAAGLDHCRGDAAIIMAADLQDPPTLIRDFVDRWRDGYQIVWGARSGRAERGLRQSLTRLFYGLVRRYAIPTYPKGGTGSFCLIGRPVIETFRMCAERNRLTFGLIAWSGFRETQVPYHRPGRAAGTTAWTGSKLIKSALDTFISFSFAPIRAISYLGLIVSVLSFIIGIYVVLNWLFLGSRVEGWTSVMVTVLFLGGVQLVMTGVLGEYLWRILEEARARPLYVVERSLGFTSEPASAGQAARHPAHQVDASADSRQARVT